MITRNWASKFDFLNQNHHKIETCTIAYITNGACRKFEVGLA